MLPIRLIPADTKIEFIRLRWACFVFSMLLVIGSVVVFVAEGLNFGVDFRGGIMMEVKTPGPAQIGALRQKLSGLGLGEVTLQRFGQPNDVLINVQAQEGGEAAQNKAIATVKDALGPNIEYRRTEFVGPKVGSELREAGTLAVLLSLAGILIYIWFRFEWQFGVAAIVALMHDVISTIGLFSLLQLEFNLSTLAAILTIAGYSINDTVVVFDRVRENMRKFKKEAMPQLLNRSVNETLSRTVLTSGTTIVAVLALFFFGGEVIHGFALAMLWGITIGTYSSIYVASPILLYMNLRRDGRGEGGTIEAEARSGRSAGAGAG